MKGIDHLLGACVGGIRKGTGWKKEQRVGDRGGGVGSGRQDCGDSSIDAASSH